MTPTECTGPLADFYDDMTWAHWMFACDPDCPMEIEQERRHAEVMAALR